MMKEERRLDDLVFVKFIRYWPVFVTLLIAATAYGAMKRDVERNSSRIDKLEEVVMQIHEIRADVKHIINRLDEKD